MNNGYDDFNPEEFIDPSLWLRATQEEKHNASLAVHTSIYNYLFGATELLGFLPEVIERMQEEREKLPLELEAEIDPIALRVERDSPRIYQTLTELGIFLKYTILLVESETRERQDRIHYPSAEIIGPHFTFSDYSALKKAVQLRINDTGTYTRECLQARADDFKQLGVYIWRFKPKKPYSILRRFINIAGALSLADQFQTAARAMKPRFKELSKSMLNHTFPN